MDFITYLAGEAKAIAQAPVTFISLALVIGLMMYFLVRHQFADRIASMESRLQLKDDRISDYEGKLKGASPDEAAATIADLQRRLAALEPITLDEEQCRSVLATVSGAPSSVSILHDSASGNMTKKMHSQLVDIFNRGGWRVRAPMVMGIGNPPPSGLAIIGHPESEEVQIVVAAFRTAGIRFDLQPNPARPGQNEEAKVEILVTTPVL